MLHILRVGLVTQPVQVQNSACITSPQREINISGHVKDLSSFLNGLIYLKISWNTVKPFDQLTTIGCKTVVNLMNNRISHKNSYAVIDFTGIYIVLMWPQLLAHFCPNPEKVTSSFSCSKQPLGTWGLLTWPLNEYKPTEPLAGFCLTFSCTLSPSNDRGAIYNSNTALFTQNPIIRRTFFLHCVFAVIAKLSG